MIASEHGTAEPRRQDKAAMTRPVEQHDCALAASASGCLRVVVSEDPRPDTVEDVLNVCPTQAFSFGEFCSS